jgi:hypothetical protein
MARTARGDAAAVVERRRGWLRMRLDGDEWSGVDAMWERAAAAAQSAAKQKTAASDRGGRGKRSEKRSAARRGVRRGVQCTPLSFPPCFLLAPALAAFLGSSAVLCGKQSVQSSHGRSGRKQTKHRAEAEAKGTQEGEQTQAAAVAVVIGAPPPSLCPPLSVRAGLFGFSLRPLEAEGNNERTERSAVRKDSGKRGAGEQTSKGHSKLDSVPALLQR